MSSSLLKLAHILVKDDSECLRPVFGLIKTKALGWPLSLTRSSINTSGIGTDLTPAFVFVSLMLFVFDSLAFLILIRLFLISISFHVNTAASPGRNPQ